MMSSVANIAYIMRGLPGSGKSTRARELAGPTGKIHSTNDLFYIEGIYRFNFNFLAEYHRLNLQSFKDSLRAGTSVVICDNCNVKLLEFEPYVRLARQYDYEVRIVEMPHLDLETLLARNIHSVPAGTIEKYRNLWQSL